MVKTEYFLGYLNIFKIYYISNNFKMTEIVYCIKRSKKNPLICFKKMYKTEFILEGSTNHFFFLNFNQLKFF